MPKKNTSKKPNNARILYLAKILSEHTDETSGLTLHQIQEKLAEDGFEVERKSLYRDFDILEEFGLELGKIAARPVAYYLKTRLFEPSQMMLLIDAVQSSKSITKANSATLIKKLKELTSENIAKQFDARIHVTDRVKMQNESVFSILDNIQRAIAERRDISFSYMKYDVKKNLCEIEAHDGKPRVRTPLYIVYNSENYYLLTYDDAASENIRVYRVDRMSGVRLAERSAKSHKLPSGFDIADYERRMIGMFAGKPVAIKLQVAEDKLGAIIDLFGVDEVECTPAKGVVELDAAGRKAKGTDRSWANVRIKAAANPVFYGHIAQFGGDVRIVSPKSVVEGYEAHLNLALKAQKASRI